MPGAGKKPSRKSLVNEFLRVHETAEIDPLTLTELRRFVSENLGGASVSDRYLLDLAEQAGVTVGRELGGLPADLRARVHFHNFAVAEESLRDLQQEYERARSSSDHLRMQDCRRAVLRGKERLTALLRRSSLSPAKRTEKEEMVSWFRVWLETPELFADWLELRKRARFMG